MWWEEVYSGGREGEWKGGEGWGQCEGGKKRRERKVRVCGCSEEKEGEKKKIERGKGTEKERWGGEELK